ncbi:uncharacterized protein LOC126603206 isoform X3 [Malus sylvestris]|uniref:uncharacterized protein LOC126603206 isoform X3 n=1 Tax=Malus sylvestris TaxID=3752 RepID=UPI0021ABEFDC|nr:uncharacterized protein LOC126603206 isoform X3 [Malus sylvestris]
MSENLKHPLELDSISNSQSTQRPSKISKTADDLSDGEQESQQPQSMSQHPRIQRYLLAIEYIGTRFSGSQQQSNCRTVVGVLEEAFRKFIGQPVSIFCSSRTLEPHEPAVVKKAVNHFLQKNEGDVMVIDVRSVPADFHARYKAQERTYFYRFLSRPEPLSTFEKDRAWHVPEELDLCSMQEACKVLVGHHDFSSFRAAGCQAKSPIRTLDELNVSEVVSSPCFPSIMERKQNNLVEEDPHAHTNKLETDTPSSFNEGQGFGVRKKHRCFVVTARARSFLYHQVRLLVGVLKCVGTGDLKVPDVERILNAKTVTAASPMAPACGLYLGQVKYDLP